MKLENISYLFIISSVLALEDRLSAVVAGLLHRNAKGASPLFARAAKKDAILNQEEIPPYLSIESLGDSFILDKSFSKDDGSGLERRQLMLFDNEYEGACATPAILYYNTNHTGVCGCDDSLQDFNRIVCMVDEADCSLGLCIEERDVWTFHKNSGQLVSRSTCLDCAVTETNCLEWEDICFRAQFNHDTNWMETCDLVMVETGTICNNCAPCRQEDGTWGMDFFCFDGIMSTHGKCLSDLRLGLHPFDTDKGSVIVASGDSSDQTPSTENLQNDKEQGNNEQSDAIWASTTSDDSSNDGDSDKLVLVIAIVGSILCLLLTILICVLVCFIRQRKYEVEMAASAFPVEGVSKTDINDDDDHTWITELGKHPNIHSSALFEDQSNRS